jgi:hypothetical protein
VDLLELEAVQVVGEGVVGCVFEVLGGVSMAWMRWDGERYRRGSGLQFSV